MTNTQFYLNEIKNVIDTVEDLQYEPIDRKYQTVQIVLTLSGYLVLATSALLLLLLDNCLWFFLAEGIILIAMSINFIIVRKAWIFKGFALREYDISYRSGIIFPIITTIPYNRMQQVSVKQNPVSKFFNLYSVEVVNGAQAMSSLTIPGLTEERANQIKNIVIDRLRHEQD